jgi:hypothetical protein
MTIYAMYRHVVTVCDACERTFDMCIFGVSVARCDDCGRYGCEHVVGVDGACVEDHEWENDDRDE